MKCRRCQLAKSPRSPEPSRLTFASEHASRSQANLEAANGRIVDVDIAEESTRLAKYNILVQASASMLAQANTAPQIALMLLG